MLDLLRNKIDVTQVPFSDRGSRLLIFKQKDESRLSLKLAERLMEVDPALEAHVHRPPFLRDLCLLGSDGQALDFHLETSPAVLTFSTELGRFELTFQDELTLAFGLPADSTCGIRFTLLKEHYLMRTGGESSLRRMISYSTNSRFVKNETKPAVAGEMTEILVRSNEDSSLALRVSNTDRSADEPAPFSAIRAAAIACWQAWFEGLPAVAEPYRQTYAYAWWVLANNLVSPQGQIKYEAAMPTKAKYIGLWLWDSALHAIAFRHVDAQLARDQIRVFLPHQLPDGMFPDVVFDEGAVTEIDHPVRARVTKPPILAWAALKIHRAAPDLDFLKEIYGPLTRWNAWWFNQSDGGVEGLAHYNHPYSSGLDDNPLWDEGMPVVSPELNTYLCLQMKALAHIATELGLETEAAQWGARSHALVRRMVEILWDEEAGVFHALHNGHPVNVLTPFNLYPLWTGDLSPEINARLLDHLQNPGEFWGDLMLPTVARNDPKYSPETMWRGPIWTNINYFFIEALETMNLQEAAAELRDKTLKLIMKAAGIYEYYNPETGQPPVSAAPMFGWSAAVFIDLAIRASAPV